MSYSDPRSRLSDIVRVRDATRRVLLILPRHSERPRVAMIAPVGYTPQLRAGERARTVLEMAELEALDLSMTDCRVLSSHASNAVMMPMIWRDHAARALGAR